MAKRDRAADAAAEQEPDALDEPVETSPTVLLKKLRLTPAEIIVLGDYYRELATADDDAAKALSREIAARLRRVTHAERHPDEPTIEVNVPLARDKNRFQINNKEYFGPTRVPLCVAQELLYMISRNAIADDERLRDNGRAEVHLGVAGQGGFIADMARRIAQVP